MPGLLEYYPSESYLKKGWAGEKIPLEALKALALAQKQAVSTGLLSTDLANRMLPNALVEGRFDDFGVNGYMYPPNPGRDGTIQKMGLRIGQDRMPPDEVTRNWGDTEWENFSRSQPRYDVYKSPSGYSLDDDASEAKMNNAAKLAAVILAEKSKLYGDDKAIARWNGNGKRLDKTGRAYADSNNHAMKVEAMLKMLSHPSNAAMVKTYKGFLGD